MIRKENEGAFWVLLTVFSFCTWEMFREYSLRNNSLRFSLSCTLLGVHYSSLFKRFLKK